MSVPTIPQIIPIPNRNVKDITGQQFGRLTVIGYVRSTKTGSVDSSVSEWLCLCECGRQAIVSAANLRSGNTKSCGCLKLEMIAKTGKNTRKHGRHDTAEYHAWESMKARCENPNGIGYKRYGGRGISICQRWRDSFENFFADMGLRPTPNHSVDRIDNDGDYCPENCRWATKSEQANNRRCTYTITHNGMTHTVAEWSEITGINHERLCERIFRYRWTPERALTTPIRKISRRPAHLDLPLIQAYLLPE